MQVGHVSSSKRPCGDRSETQAPWLALAVAGGLLATGVAAIPVNAGPAMPSFTLHTLPLSSGDQSRAQDVTHTVFIPVVLNPPPTPTPTATPASECPATSSNVYSTVAATQYDTDNPVRPAWNHADKNLALRGYVLNTGSLKRELVNYGTDDPTQPPQFATLFSPNKVPAFAGFYQVRDWNWGPSPAPGTPGNPLDTWQVTALGLATARGETLHVPSSAYDIGQGKEAMVIFADADSIALRYTREDSSGAKGYTVHVDKICTDPNLLALYDTTDNSPGPRYVYPNASYPLPALEAGQVFGTARGAEIVVAVVDTGSFMDPRSCNEWWQIRPGYGSCPSPW